MRRSTRITAALIVLMTLALPAWALTIRGLPGSVHQVASLQVDPDDVGEVCEVYATVINGDSTHTGNELRIEETRFEDVEGRPNTTEVFGATLALDSVITAQVRLSETPTLPPIPQYPEGRSVWSADVILTYECPPDETTTTTQATTTTTQATTTTTVPVTTTTAPETTTTTLPPPPGLGFDCESNRIILWGLYPGTWEVAADGKTVAEWDMDDTLGTTTWDHAAPEGGVNTLVLHLPDGSQLSVEVDCELPTTTTVPDTTTTTIPPVTTPTLPFTGPEDLIGLGMAGVALIALGAPIVRALRTER